MKVFGTGGLLPGHRQALAAVSRAVWLLVSVRCELPGGARYSRLLFALFVLKQVTGLLGASRWRGVVKDEGAVHLRGELYDDDLTLRLLELGKVVDDALIVLEGIVYDLQVRERK